MIVVHMKGMIEPVQADEDFASAINALNMSAAQGKQFMVVDGLTGRHIGISIPNINTIEEPDD